MESKNICLKVCLFFTFWCLSWIVVAQINNNDNERKQLLLGEWVWEDASIADDKHPVSFDLYNDYCKFYPQIKVNENTVFLKDGDEKIQEVKYEVDGNYLGIDLPSGESLIAEWAIFEDKLYLEFSNTHPYDLSRKINLLVIYKKK